MPLLVWAGCSTVDPNGPSVDETDVAGPPITTNVFTEDAEPAIAALPFVADELLVQPFPGADPEALTDAYRAVGASVSETLPEIDLTVLRVPEGTMDSAAAELASHELIEDIQKNYLFDASTVPNDPLFDDQRYLRFIGAPDAWDETVGADDVLIAVVDTGVDPGHPDLAGKIVEGWNVYMDTADSSDTAGHGTQVAGVAAAMSDNGVGIVGVAWNAKILAVRATDAGGSTSSRSLAAGILWANGHGARVINVSFAPLWSNRVVRSAAQTAFNRGSLVIISAGNGGGTTAKRGYSQALFVGAVTEDAAPAGFSDRGAFVDLVAPGTNIRTTQVGSGYGEATGTSFAAPIVSGVAGLVWSVNEDLRPVTVSRILQESARDLGDAGRDAVFGSGLVRADEALRAARTIGDDGDDSPPQVRLLSLRDGDRIESRRIVEVAVEDAGGVADVALAVDGATFAADARAPFRFLVDPAYFQLGVHELSIVATDTSGNTSGPIRVAIEIAGEPDSRSARIAFRSPEDGTSVAGDVTLQVTVSDPDGLSTLEWLVDGESAFVAGVSGRSVGASFLWRTAGVAAGPHRITVTVTDRRGRLSAASITLHLQLP